MTTFRYPQPPKWFPCPHLCGDIGTAHWLHNHVRDTGATETLPPGRCPVLFARRNVNRPGVIGALIERGHCHEAA